MRLDTIERLEYCTQCEHYKRHTCEIIAKRVKSWCMRKFLAEIRINGCPIGKF